MELEKKIKKILSNVNKLIIYENGKNRYDIIIYDLKNTYYEILEKELQEALDKIIIILNL